jgi:hypothetical protein
VSGLSGRRVGFVLTFSTSRVDILNEGLVYCGQKLYIHTVFFGRGPLTARPALEAMNHEPV